MGQFSIDGRAEGIRAASRGIKDALVGYMRGDAVQQQAYLDSMGKVKTAEEARALKMTNDHRENADRYATDETLTPHHKAALMAFKLLGADADRFSKSASIEQEIGTRDAIIKDPSLATNVAKAFFATSGKAPFDNVGDTGYAMNKVTGEAIAANPVMAKLFQATEGSLANQRNASAGEHNARRDRVNSGLDHTVTTLDENGRPMVTALPTKGGANMIAPAKPTSSGADATNDKARNSLVAQIEKEMPGLSDEKFKAEFDKRWARRTQPGTNKNPAPAPAQPTMEQTIPHGYTYAGKDKKTGKTVVKDASGKLFIME